MYCWNTAPLPFTTDLSIAMFQTNTLKSQTGNLNIVSKHIQQIYTTVSLIRLVQYCSKSADSTTALKLFSDLLHHTTYLCIPGTISVSYSYIQSVVPVFMGKLVIELILWKTLSTVERNVLKWWITLCRCTLGNAAELPLGIFLYTFTWKLQYIILTASIWNGYCSPNSKY